MSSLVEPTIYGDTDTTGDVVFVVGKGIILTTPDGTKQYKITVDDTGALISTLV